MFFFVNSALGQSKKVYVRLVDSADQYLSSNPELAKQFLDSIEPPFEKTIKGRLGEYFLFKALLNGKENKQAELYQNYLLALKYAEKEKNFDIAGQASLELFSKTYFINRDTTAFRYLDMARKFYKLGNNANGLLEVLQMPAYVEFLNDNLDKSNELILANLDKFRGVEDDAYYHLFAVYMLASNYVHLGELQNANIYLKEFQSLKTNPTLDAYIYNFYDSRLNVCMAEIQLEKKQIDSVFHYLEKASLVRQDMSHVAIEDYFSTYSEAYAYVQNDKESMMYLDSLRIFQQKMFEHTLDASLKINEVLFDSEENLKRESEKKLKNLYLAITLLVILAILTALFFIRDNKFRRELREYINQNRQLSKVKSKNKKLKLKSHSLEEYIVELKKKIKEIAVSEDISEQRVKIKELYKDLHIESATIIDSVQNHLELVSNLDVKFFENLKNEYPNLNDLETIICYYSFVGFKNREIALFLNRTVRAIESQRYRISKKIGIDKSNVSLVEQLNYKFRPSE